MRKVKIVYPNDSLLDSIKIIDISNWEKLSHEWKGTRDKVIIKHPITGHLEFPNPDRTDYEPALLEAGLTGD